MPGDHRDDPGVRDRSDPGAHAGDDPGAHDRDDPGARDRDDDASAADGRADRLRERVRRETRAAGSGAETAPDPAVLDDLISGLDADDPEERAEAAWELAELASDHPDRSWRLPVETKLAPLLDDRDRWVRRGASWAVVAVAADHPGRARRALPALAESLTDEDPLVRENGVLALSDVAQEYPLAVEPALDRLAAVASDGDGLSRRYAAETLRRLVRKLDEDGFPETIAATPAVADLLPDHAGVVEVTDDPGDDQPVQVGDASDRGDRGREREDATSGNETEEDDGMESLGPPELIPAPSPVDADREDLTYLGNLGGDPLTTAAKARAPAGAEDAQGVVVTVRTLRSDLDVDAADAEAAFRAWAGADDHDHVLAVLARGRTPRPWVATEFADAGTLRNHLGGVGVDRALWYAHCVTTAVCHAHARGVVHGALRPGAVGLSRALGAWPVPKVGDWGLGELVAEVRRPPVPAGFAAPEHVAPDEFGRPDSATDVYGLGALCYALFAGRPPFVGESGEAVARQVRNQQPPVPSAFAPDLPAAVDDLVDRALAKEKRARFETAEDVRRELEVVAAEHGQIERW